MAFETDYIVALHSLIDSYEILGRFHEGIYDFSDEEEEAVSKWRSVIWGKIEEYVKYLES